MRVFKFWNVCMLISMTCDVFMWNQNTISFLRERERERERSLVKIADVHATSPSRAERGEP